MNKKVIIIGASGHGKVVADIVLAAGDEVVGFIDDNKTEKTFIGFPLLGCDSVYKDYPDCYFVVAIGDSTTRERVVEKMQGAKWYTAIHPDAVISSIDTTIGEGTVVMPGVVINPGATIGRHCIINTSSVVEHDDYIDDFVHISVGAKVAGTVHIGRGTWVGIGATISNNISICEDCILGAGTVVVKDITQTGTYVGVPARKV